MNEYYYLAVPTTSTNYPIQVVESFVSRDALMDSLGRANPEDEIYNNYYVCIALLTKKIQLGKYAPRAVIKRKSTPLAELLTNGKGDYPQKAVEFGHKLRNLWTKSRNTN